MATKQKVIDVHRAHPNWNGPQIARHLKCSESYVRVVSARSNLKLPRKIYERDPTGSIQSLGEACKRAGLTLKDIEQRATEGAE